MSLAQHTRRVSVLTLLAAALLFWLARHTEILFADGLRYIEQAQRIENGAWREGLLKSVDHPMYPLAMAAVHHWLGGDGPYSWQRAAQATSLLAGVLLVLPLYLVAIELFGAESAWLACLLTYAVPLTGHVLADALSEGTFLLFWTWGLWAAFRFLREGAFGWLPLTITLGALAYLSRPEGLLLPAALVATLLVMPVLRATRLNWPRWWAAIGFLLIGPALLVGPYVAVKGGLGTKPAIARLLGTAPPAPASAVERLRPLDPNQTPARTYYQAVKAVGLAVRDAVTVPLLVLTALGVVLAWPPGPKARVWLFVGVIEVASVLALVRLHATGGYCSPRHAMVLAFLLIPAAAFAIHRAISAIAIPGSWLGLGEGVFRPGPAVWGLLLCGIAALYGKATLAPVNEGFGAYRLAGAWLAEHVPPGTPVVDVTGWSLFYGQRPGYTFANLHESFGNPELRWVIAREAHMKGPWHYCDQLRTLVAERRPVEVFQAAAQRGQVQVYVFDLQSPAPRSALQEPDSPRR